jgi:hypothetical protein
MSNGHTQLVERAAPDAPAHRRRESPCDVKVSALRKGAASWRLCLKSQYFGEVRQDRDPARTTVLGPRATTFVSARTCHGKPLLEPLGLAPDTINYCRRSFHIYLTLRPPLHRARAEMLDATGDRIGCLRSPRCDVGHTHHTRHSLKCNEAKTRPQYVAASLRSCRRSRRKCLLPFFRAS